MDENEIRQTAQREFVKHRLEDWSLVVSSRIRRRSDCRYSERCIVLSERYISDNPGEVVIGALLHEIAHAIAGKYANHGPAWIEAAEKVGAPISACDELHECVSAQGEWQSTCPGCGRSYYKFKRSSSSVGYRCKCGSRSQLVFEERKSSSFQTVTES